MMTFLRNAWPVLVIVATIAGAAWTAAWNVRDFLRTEIAASESRLAARIAATETRITAQNAATDARVTSSETRLTTQIAELRQLLVDHLRDHAQRPLTGIAPS